VGQIKPYKRPKEYEVMQLVIRTDCRQKDLLEHPKVKTILSPFDPVFSEEPLNFETECYYYVTLSDNAPIKELIPQLMQIESIEAAYEKPLDFPPL